jgi:AraC-like DNA-binding protein
VEFQFDLGQLARECIMSKYCLVRNFKQLFHVPPQKYFTTRKMEFARSLLARGNHIGAVAFRVGYPDVYGFSKQFKKYMGVSPGRIRKHRSA